MGTVRSTRETHGQRMQRDGLHRENGEFRRQQSIAKWRATVDEDGHYSFAVAL
jgi:hypothetical protein